MNTAIIHAALEAFPAPPELHYHEVEIGVDLERLLTCAALYDDSPVGNWLKKFCGEVIRLSNARESQEESP